MGWRSPLRVAVSVLMLAQSALADDRFRCRGGLVSIGDTPLEVKRKCGPPNREYDGYATVEQRLRTGATRLIEVRVVEWWYLSQTKFARLLIFQDGRVIRIERQDW